MVAITGAALGKSSYSTDWIIGKLAKREKKFDRRLKNNGIKEVQYERIDGGNGVMSKVFRVEISFNDDEKPWAVALKVLNADGLNILAQSLFDDETNQQCSDGPIVMHEREIRFYECFADRHVPFLPKIYAAETYKKHERDGCLLMECLTEKGTLISNCQSYNVAQILSVTQALARLAVESLAMGERVKQLPVNLNVVNALFELTARAAKSIPSYRPELRLPLQRLHSIVSDPKFFRYAYDVCNDLDIPPVLTQSDMHAFNLIFKKDKNENATNDLYAIIDFQGAHAGHIAHDLAGLTVMCASGKLRREVEKWIIEFYYSLLKNELKQRGMKMPYTVDQIRRAYRIAVVRQTLFLVQAAPVMVGRIKIETERDRKDVEYLWKLLKDALDDSYEIMQKDLPKFLY